MPYLKHIEPTGLHEVLYLFSFCLLYTSGDYDAVIIGHSQFEKIPLSPERQERQLREQIDEIEGAIAELKHQNGENFTIKQMEKTLSLIHI